MWCVYNSNNRFFFFSLHLQYLAHRHYNHLIHVYLCDVNASDPKIQIKKENVDFS